MTMWAYSSVIEEIYQAAAEPDGWRRLVPKLAHLFHSESGTLFTRDVQSGTVEILSVTANYDAKAIADYEAYYHKLDFWTAAALQAEVGKPFLCEQFTSENEILGSEVYNDFCKPLGIFHGSGNLIPIDGHMVGVFGFHRPRTGLPFDEQDLRTLELLSRHLIQALRLYYRLAAAQRSGMIATAALDTLPTAVIAVETDRTLRFANTAAERLLAAGRGLTVNHGRLRCTDRTADAALGPLIQQAAQAAVGKSMGAGGVLPAPRNEGRPLSLLVCPLRPETMALGPIQPMALIFIGDPDDHRPAPAEMLVRLYGLTPAEARLTQALLAGDTLQDFAGRMGVSLHTAKTQLKQVFAKTGAGRQAELVRDLLGNPVLGMGAPKK
ncbi:hypothetical protein [Magnetospirillum sp. 15-1]|uniref:hypothetical protein n=1 Tax=Magnetospirillum sp. 15-1 TaxID=1979370 RepID=UPI00114298AC|nr:hypothetical protein [Magnetospirillum sp. 15-1]